MPIDVDRGYVPNLRDGEGNVIVAQPNAGVITRFSPEGIAVHMYWQQPGVYFGDHGQELPEAMAKAARYDVDRLGRERMKREALATAAATIEQEYKATSTREVINERGSYRLVHVGNEMHNIEFEDGTLMNGQPLAKDVALRVFDQLAPPPEVKKAK